MEFILVFATAFFASVATWLWWLAKGQPGRVSVYARLAPFQQFSSDIRATWRARIGSSLGSSNRGFGKLRRSREPQSEEPRQLAEICYAGEAKLPKKIYVGDSQSLDIKLRRKTLNLSCTSEPVLIEDSETGESIILRVSQSDIADHFLEVELLAAGLEVDGKKKQRQSLTLETLSYAWNCHFKNSGHHSFTLILRLISDFKSAQIGVIEHSTKVVQLDHLTKRQVWTLASLGSVLAGILAATLDWLDILDRLGIL